jgi:MoxR-like ATPase
MPAQQVRAHMERVIVDKGPVVEAVLVVVPCEGRVLIEDLPGIGKTLLARLVARYRPVMWGKRSTNQPRLSRMSGLT